MSPKLALLVAAVVALVAGAVVLSGWGRPYKVEPYPYETFDIKETFADYTLAARLFAGGKPVGTLAMGQQLTFSGEGLPRDGSGVPALETEMQTPCGWQRIETVVVRKPGVLADVFRIGHDLMVAPKVHRRFNLAYDNRGGSAATLKVGELEIPVAAGSAGILHLAADGCSGEAEVRAGNEPLGKIPLELDQDKEMLDSHLVVLAGKHCYVSQTVAYGGVGTGEEEHLNGARLYKISAGEFEFPKEAPGSLEVEEMVSDGHRYGGYAQRHYVWDEACD